MQSCPDTDIDPFPLCNIICKYDKIHSTPRETKIGKKVKLKLHIDLTKERNKEQQTSYFSELISLVVAL